MRNTGHPGHPGQVPPTAGVLATVVARFAAPPVPVETPPVPAPPPVPTADTADWNDEEAAACLARLHDRLDRALAKEAHTPAHRNLLAAFRHVFATHLEKQDLTLFTSMAWLENELVKWKS